MEHFVAYAAVVLDNGLDKVLDYGITNDLLSIIKPGVQVAVPVRQHLKEGYVIAIKEKPDFLPVQPIATALSENPLIPLKLLELAEWMSKYYCTPIRKIIKMILPSSIRKGMSAKEQLFVMRAKSREELRNLCIKIREKKPSQAAIIDAILPIKKGILLTELLETSTSSRSAVDSLIKQGYLTMEKVQIDRSPLKGEEYFMTKPKILNVEQASALQKISLSITENRFETHLLFGVTGSGKTEVYLQAIEKAIQLNKGVIMLVPEISLTAQTIERFRSRFDEKLAVLHYRLSDGERNDEWHRIYSGQANIVIGARSAIFSPVVNLGLIIVDEEHEQTYKQNDIPPCYQARDVAVMRGKLINGTVILGSATPSLESFYNAKNNKYSLSILRERAESAELPHISIVDMRKEFDKAKGWINFSDPLLTAIEKRYQQGEKVIIFLNRRGYHTTLLCQACQKTVKCNHCDLPMTFHRGENSLSCHLCGYQLTPPPKQCPYCRNGTPLKFRGVGTEQIEGALQKIFPTMRTIRIDADTTRHKGSHQKLLRDFATGKGDLLIGTQMIAKGLHFPEVTLVGILNSDVGLNIPDFRASETVFQMITQVAGRSGRGTLAGEVIIQTSLPDHSIIQHAAKQDYLSFYEEEIMTRQIFGYPPFKHMAKLVFSGKHSKEVEKVAEGVRQIFCKQLPSTYELHPVIPCGHAKVKDLYRFQFIVQGPIMTPLYQILQMVQTYKLIPYEVRFLIDINPSTTFF